MFSAPNNGESSFSDSSVPVFRDDAFSPSENETTCSSVAFVTPTAPFTLCVFFCTHTRDLSAKTQGTVVPAFLENSWILSVSICLRTFLDVIGICSV